MQSPSDGSSNNPPHAPLNDGARPSPQSSWPRWVYVVFFYLLFTLWYTYDALVDFDGLMDLFGWTWALIIIYVIYIVMDVICADGCVDGWDIYVMDEIYMWYMFAWIYLSWWNVKKLKIDVLGHFAKCCTQQRTPLPSAMVTALGKAGKNGRSAKNLNPVVSNIEFIMYHYS